MLHAICTNESRRPSDDQSRYVCASCLLPYAARLEEAAYLLDVSWRLRCSGYYDDLVVLALKPSRGPIGGGTYVEVNGVHIDHASAILNEIYCRFNMTYVAATFVSSSLLSCVAPKSVPGYANVEISMNLVDYSRCALLPMRCYRTA